MTLTGPGYGDRGFSHPWTLVLLKVVEITQERAYSDRGGAADQHPDEDDGPVRTFAIVIRGHPSAFRELHRAAEDLGCLVVYERTSPMKLFIDERPF